MKQFRWNKEKNIKLSGERGISFETIVYAIHKGGLVDVFAHPNPQKYPTQSIYAVNINDYIYLVPFVKEKDGVRFLKTIIPSRKATRKYLRSNKK
ncbi:MAG: toxin [Candidatus Electrothrix sp. AR3]|nr:toxin [Candidatus Electrothrix sp. AR3]